MSDVAVVIVARGEPVERLQRMLSALSAQDADGPFEVLLAVPPDEVFRLRAVLQPAGTVRSIRLIANPTGGRSVGLNLAIHAAAAAVVVRVDARSVVPRDYVRRCAARLDSCPEVGVVGGVQRAVPAGGGIVARSVARALRNPWFLGSPAYRRPGAVGPVDTVYLGAYRRVEVLSVGGYDEQLEANEDFDLARRFRQLGFQVWLERDLNVDYEARATIVALAAQYWAFGKAKVRFWRLRNETPNRRQAVALAGVFGGLAFTLVAIAIRPRIVPVAVAGAVSGLLALDAAGGGGKAPLIERCVSAAAGATAIVSWVGGVGAEALKRSPASAPAPPWPTPQSPRQR